MIPINSASEFKSFLDDLREWTSFKYGNTNKYLAIKLYAKFPQHQHNSVMDYGDRGTMIRSEYVKCLEGGLAPYYIMEPTPMETNGTIITKERYIFTYAPFNQLTFYGVEVKHFEEQFLEWRASKSSSE